nr:MAG: hypothetical protein H3Bulk421011_000001 [Mitovirus sp.]
MPIPVEQGRQVHEAEQKSIVPWTDFCHEGSPELDWSISVRKGRRGDS